MAKQPYDKHLPTWVWTVAGLLNEQAEIRFFCRRCELLFDVDLGLIARVRGRGFSLVHHQPRCKLSTCRSHGFFLAAHGMHAKPIVLLRNDPADSPWRSHWTFHAFEVDMRARVGADPTVIARRTAVLPYLPYNKETDTYEPQTAENTIKDGLSGSRVASPLRAFPTAGSPAAPYRAIVLHTNARGRQANRLSLDARCTNVRQRVSSPGTRWLDAPVALSLFDRLGESRARERSRSADTASLRGAQQRSNPGRNATVATKLDRHATLAMTEPSAPPPDS